LVKEEQLVILIMSDFAVAKTGFGKNTKNVATYLSATGKYKIINYCCGVQYSHPELQRTPWKSIGCLPDNPNELEQINRDPNLARLASYGSVLLDRVIQEEKPDVFLAVQDIWGVDFSIDRVWFDKINSVIWTTLDSVPILPAAIESAKKSKNFWVWSNFAEKALHELGHKHVKTMHGPVDDSNFKRLNESGRKGLRTKFNLSQNAFIIGFVFRNQLRKSVIRLFEGYAMWKKRNPEVKNTFLLLHTSFSEGWNIHRNAEIYGVPKEEILTTYICKECKNYEVKQFSGQDIRCSHCGGEKTQTTTNILNGVSEEQLNEIYNIMDVYCHPFTSGGQEIPILEAKFTELITLVTNYSCGEELCEDIDGTFPLEFETYHEPGTEFVKATTLPSSIAKQLNKIYSLSKEKKAELGKKGREWALANYSLKAIGPKLEAFLDGLPKISYDFSMKAEDKDPNAKIDNNLPNKEWLKSLYGQILKMTKIQDDDSGLQYWLKRLENGETKQSVDEQFRRIAAEENAKNTKIEFHEMLDKDDEGRRLLFVMPESIGDVYLTTSLLPNIKKQYPNYNIYYATKPQNFEVLEGNPYIHKLLPHHPVMENQLHMEGAGGHKGYFELAFYPFIGTQRFLDYLHNGKTNIQIDIKDETISKCIS
jgi:glycosyltransferase involved in cell wall biosynthesis